MSHPEPLTGMMNDVARELLGVPNERMSRERDGVLRFGSNGSIEVNTAEGWFADYADRLARLGLVATTNPGGAGKFLREFAPFLADRRVAVLEDNDQAGRDHAADVVSKLDGIAADVVALKLPGLPQKGDVSDWLNNGGSAFQLLQIAEGALGTDALPLPTLDLAELAKTRAKAKLFAIERIAPLAETTLFTGPGSAGKSLLGQQLATAGAAGLPCLGLNVQPGPTLYLTCEDDAEQLHWRQEHLCASMGVSMASLGGPSQPGPALPRSVMKVTRERHQAGPKTIVVRRRITPRRDRDPGQIEGSRNEDE